MMNRRALIAAAVAAPAITLPIAAKATITAPARVTVRQIKEIRRVAAYAAGRQGVPLYHAPAIVRSALDSIGVDLIDQTPADRFPDVIAHLHSLHQSD